MGTIGFYRAAYAIRDSLQWVYPGIRLGQVANALGKTKGFTIGRKGRIVTNDPKQFLSSLAREIYYQLQQLELTRSNIEANIRDSHVVPLTDIEDQAFTPESLAETTAIETTWPTKDDGNLCLEGWNRLAAARALSIIATKVIAKHLNGKNRPFLEVGPGTGFFYRHVAPEWIKPDLSFLELSSSSVERLSGFISTKRITEGNVYNLAGLYRDLEGILSYTAFSTYFHLDRAIDQVFKALAPGGVFVYFKDAIPFDPAVIADLKAKGLFPWEGDGWWPGAFRLAEDRDAMQVAFEEARAVLPASVKEMPRDRESIAKIMRFQTLYLDKSIDLRRYFLDRLVARLKGAGFQILFQGDQKAHFIGSPQDIHKEHPTDPSVYALNLLSPLDQQMAQLDIISMGRKARKALRTEKVIEMANMQVVVAQKPRA